MSTKAITTWLALPAIMLMSVAQANAQQGPLNKAEVEQTIRAYLLDHPEILVEMSQALQTRAAIAKREKSQAALEAQREALHGGSLGSPAAGAAADGTAGTVTIVEFFDYRCGYCKKVQPVIQKLIAEDARVRVVFKEFPILGPDSSNAARAALAAHRQGQYGKFHQALMAATDLTPAGIDALAVASGLDAAQLKKDMAAEELTAAINGNYTLGQALGIEATPAFVVGDEIVAGALDENALRQLVAKARAKGAPRASR